MNFNDVVFERPPTGKMVYCNGSSETYELIDTGWCYKCPNCGKTDRHQGFIDEHQLKES